MKILLDTHLLLWALENSPYLPGRARALIEEQKNELFYSTASIWEVAIKHMAKPDKMFISGEELADLCDKAGFVELPICKRHIFQLGTLKRPVNAPPHKDPFDRLLIAQAKVEDIVFATHDLLLPYYEEECILFV